MIGENILRPLRMRPFATPALHLLLNYFKRIQIGRLHVQVEGYTTQTLGNTHDPDATLVISKPTALLRRVMLRGDIGFAESYIAGEWSSPDLTKLLHLLALNQRELQSSLNNNIGLLSNRLRHRLRANHRSGSRRNIHAHYDLGNDFYRLWLDSSMSYSAAVFSDLHGASFSDLTAAQEHKYARMLALINAQPGDHILEIGCGWGGFALAAARRGLRVTGITLSKEQLSYAQARVTEAGLNEQIELRLQDYRDLDRQFDHIVSIEMMEAVGEAYWETYFATLQRCVKPGGRIALQVITIDEQRFAAYRTHPDFIQLHIFPGGMLPTRSIMQSLGTQAGLEWKICDRLGQHYAKTCELWDAQCSNQRSEIQALGYDDQFLRRWHYYLAYCQAGFRTGAVDLVQVALQRPE